MSEANAVSFLDIRQIGKVAGQIDQTLAAIAELPAREAVSTADLIANGMQTWEARLA